MFVPGVLCFPGKPEWPSTLMLRYDALIESLYESVSLTEAVQAFHDMLFSVLLDLNDDDETIAVALMCVRLLMHERREVSLERVAAFVRRLCEAALRMRPHQVGTHRDRPTARHLTPFAQAVATLFNVRALLHKYPKLEPILDGDAMTTTTYCQLWIPFVCSVSYPWFGPGIDRM